MYVITTFEGNVFSRRSYGYYTSSDTTYTTNWCVSPNQYTFTIFDNGGGQSLLLSVPVNLFIFSHEILSHKMVLLMTGLIHLHTIERLLLAVEILVRQLRRMDFTQS